MVDWARAKDYLKDIRRFPEFCERFMKIQPEAGAQLIPFKLNPVQEYVLNEHVIPAYLRDDPVRLVILKGRQHGISTFFQALALWSTVGHESWNSLVIGKDRDQTRTIFRIIKRFNDNTPWGQVPEDTSVFPVFEQVGDSLDCIEFNRPSKTHKRKKAHKRENTLFLDSRIEVKSSEKEEELGRAGFYQFVHASEAAMWPKLAWSLGSLLSCCHPHKHTVVAIECTANGFNEFQSFWSNLKIGEREVPSMWQKVFLAWFLKPEYELPLDLGHDFQDEYEEWLFDYIKHDKTLQRIDKRVTDDRIWAKLYWRRRQIRDVFFGDVDKYKQEFPATDTEAFIFSGTSAYSARSLDKLERKLCEPKWQGNINLVRKPGETFDKAPSQIQKEPHERGYLKIWEDAEKPHRYCIFADVAEGKAIEGISEDKSKWDFSCAHVFKVTSWPPAMKQVACWHGNCDPDEFGSVLVALARMYHNALLAWEINGPGRSLALQVIQKHKYRNVYMREEVDAISRRMTNKPGWRTTSKTKPYMVAISQRYVRTEEIEICDASTLQEMRSFARIGENKYAAARGHDDRVIALCGLLAVVEPYIESFRRKYERETKKKVKQERHPDQDFFFTDPDGMKNYNHILGDEW